MLPTISELAGVPVAYSIDGISLVPTLLGSGEQEQHEYLYWEFHGQGANIDDLIHITFF